MFLTALIALAEPCTLWWWTRCYPSPKRWVGLHTSLPPAIIQCLIFLRCVTLDIRLAPQASCVSCFAPRICWRKHTIRTTWVFHSSQWHQERCSWLPNDYHWLCLSPAGCHILPLHYCYLSDATLSYISLTFRSYHLTQYSLRFAYIACCSICLAIIVFFRSEISCPIFRLSSTIPSVLHSLR